VGTGYCPSDQSLYLYLFCVVFFFCFTEFVTCFGCDSSFGFYSEHVQEAFLASSWRESVMSSERAGPGNHAFWTDPRPLAFLTARKGEVFSLSVMRKREEIWGLEWATMFFFLTTNRPISTC